MDKVIQTYVDFADRPAFIRALEIFPGAVTWLFIFSPILLSLVQPIVVAYFIIAFDLVWLIKSFRLSYCLIRGYSRLHQAEKIDWFKRMRQLNKLDSSIEEAEEDLEQWLQTYPKSLSIFRFSKTARDQHREYIRLAGELRRLKDLAKHSKLIRDPKHIYNVVIIATYNESIDILEPSIKALLEINYPLKQMMLVIAYEERGGSETESNVKALIAKYGHHFAHANSVKHPDGLPGEVRGKGGNISYAARQLTKEILDKDIDPNDVIITTFDSDHRPHKNYFSYLTYEYAIDPNRKYKSFQPIPMFYNNIWDVPAPMRVIDSVILRPTRRVSKR
jgi:hypothetical protein